MDINGRIHSRGSTSEVLTNDPKIEQEFKQDEIALKNATDVIDPQPEATVEAKKADGKLILAEETAEGRVSWAARELELLGPWDELLTFRIVSLYFKGMGGTHPVFFFTAVVVGLIGCEILNATQT